MSSWSHMKYHFGIKCHFLQSFSVSSLSRWDLVLIPSLFICNKLSNEWSAVFIAQLLLVELKKICQKSWRTWVRPDISSTFCRFELMSGRTNVLTPLLHPLVCVKDFDRCGIRGPITPLQPRPDISSNRQKVELMSGRTQVLQLF